MENDTEEYDVVIDVLTEHKNKLWTMTKRNMDNLSFNIMDSIRLDQIDEIEDCIEMWKNYKKKNIQKSLNNIM